MSQIKASALVAAAIPLSYFVLLLLERYGHGRCWPAIRGWQWIGALCFALLGVINATVSAVLQGLFGRHSLFDLSGWHPLAAAVVGYLLLSYGNAWLHRAYHRLDWLWRHVHRLHHAPARVDLAGVMWQTPWEAAANAVLFVSISVFLLGLGPLAAMMLAWFGAFFGMFQHLNLRTPRWLGYLIQRPEAHCEHHRIGRHDCNYSDLPLWDLCWGSWHNPDDFDGKAGLGVSMWEHRWELLRGTPLPSERRP